MYWPTNVDYQEAVQSPHLCFSDPELMNGIPLTDNLGLPRPVNGYYSTVYQITHGPHRHAVKCFLKYHSDQERRYERISRHLQKHRLPYMVDFSFIRDGIKIRGQWYPVVKMQWIDGEYLNSFIQRNLYSPKTIYGLAQEFSKLVQNLRRHSIAHGDLQHGNILVVNGTLRLIDYDGMYTPGLKGMQSNELGHRNYQHPNRSLDDFGVNLDSFSSWVIYLSLLGVISDPGLWDRLGAGDESLLFKKEDFLSPGTSPAFIELKKSPSRTIHAVSSLLESLIQYHGLSTIPPLDTRLFGGVSFSGVYRRQPVWINDYVPIEEVGEKAAEKSTHSGLINQLKRKAAGIKPWLSPGYKQVYRVILVLLVLFSFLLIWGVLDLIIAPGFLK